MNNLIWDKIITELDTEIDKNTPGMWEEKPVPPEEFFKEWLQPKLSEVQLDVFNNLFLVDNKLQWNKKFNEYILLWGEGCIAGNTILKDEDTGKEYTVKELAERKQKIKIKSMLKENGHYKIVIKETGIPFRKGKTKLYKVKTKSGKEIIVSEEHKFYTKEGWKELKKLKINDKIAINTNKIIFNKIESIEYAGENDYYDLEVSETHNYIAQGIVNHNSGKDWLATRIILYTAYFLMCMKNPQRYFGFADNEPIDLVNVSFSSTHAKDVFFKRLVKAVKLTINPKTHRNWFTEKGMDLRDGQDLQTTKVLFKKNITAYSLNSQKYTGEGKNILIAVFDEIAEFDPAKAKELYENLWFTAESRWGAKEDSPVRIVLLSYLRSEYDFMNYRWEQSKDEPKVYRSRKATWEVRPDKTREDYDRAFKKNPEDAARRFGNILSKRLGNRFFKYPEKIKENINKFRTKPYEEDVINIANLNDLTFKEWFRPYTIERLEYLRNLNEKTDEEKKEQELLEERHRDTQYYIHLDLAKGKTKGDAAGFAMVHPYLIDPADEDMGVGIYVDFMMQLKADRGEVDFEEIRKFIFRLEKAGFPIGCVTADSFGSIEMIQQLNKKQIDAELLSVDRTDEPYQTLKELIYSNRLDYYNYSVFIRELEELIRDGKKIDHPAISQRRAVEEGDNRGSKDCSDSVTGSAMKALSSIEFEGDWVGVDL